MKLLGWNRYLSKRQNSLYQKWTLYESYRFTIVLLSFFYSLSFYKELTLYRCTKGLKYTAVKTFIVLQRINHLYDTSCSESTKGKTFALCSSLSMGSQDLWKVSNLVHLSLMLVDLSAPGGWLTTIFSFSLSFWFVCPRLIQLKMAKYLHWHGRSPGCMSMIIVHTNLLHVYDHWRQNVAEGKREIKWTKLEIRHLLGAFSMPKEKTKDKKVRTK